MGEIIKFNPQYKVNSKEISDKDRYKAMAKGQIEGFTCNNCGEHFEVYNKNYPECCPGCNATIRWSE